MLILIVIELCLILE